MTVNIAGWLIITVGSAWGCGFCIARGWNNCTVVWATAAIICSLVVLMAKEEW